jgi:hypothetical protein
MSQASITPSLRPVKKTEGRARDHLQHPDRGGSDKLIQRIFLISYVGKIKLFFFAVCKGQYHNIVGKLYPQIVIVRDSFES